MQGFKNVDNIKIPKKTIDFQWVLDKFNKAQDKASQNIAKFTSKLIEKLSLSKQSVYGTSFGISFSNFNFTGFDKDSVEKVKGFLDDHSIEYYTNISRGGWVYHIIISKKSSNLIKLENSVNESYSFETMRHGDNYLWAFAYSLDKELGKTINNVETVVCDNGEIQLESNNQMVYDIILYKKTTQNGYTVKCFRSFDGSNKVVCTLKDFHFSDTDAKVLNASIIKDLETKKVFVTTESNDMLKLIKKESSLSMNSGMGEPCIILNMSLQNLRLTKHSFIARSGGLQVKENGVIRTLSCGKGFYGIKGLDIDFSSNFPLSKLESYLKDHPNAILELNHSSNATISEDKNYNYNIENIENGRSTLYVRGNRDSKMEIVINKIKTF